MPEVDTQDECGSMSAREAMLETGAEVAVDLIDQRRWLFLAIGLAFAIVTVVGGIWYSIYQSGPVATIVGIAAPVIGLIIFGLSIRSYFDLGSFVKRFRKRVDQRGSI